MGPLAGRWVGAEIIKTDEAFDLALLRVETDLPAAALSSGPDAPLGMEILVIGYPQPGAQGLSKKVTLGIVNGTRRDQRGGNFALRMQISAEVARGNSGGPVIALDGTVIGMVQRKLDAQRVAARTGDWLVNVGYALPASHIVTFLQDTPARPVMQTLRTDVSLRPHVVFSQQQGAVVAVIARHDRREAP